MLRRCAWLTALLAIALGWSGTAFAWVMNPDFYDPIANETHFRRAMFLWRNGDLPGVLEHLEEMDPEGAVVDTAKALPRAALLRSAAALRMADRAELEASLQAASSLAPCRELEWIAAIESMARVRGILPAGAPIVSGSGELPDAVLMRADTFLREARPEEAISLLKSDASRDVPPILREWWLARATGDWSPVVALEPHAPFERDLFGAAGIKLAAQTLERGEPADSILSRIPVESASARRALHIQGILAMNAGDSTRASVLLSQAQAGTPLTREDREIGLALAGLALDQLRWSDAHRDLVALEESWQRSNDAVAAANPELIESRIDWNAWLEEWDDSRSILADMETHERVVDAMAEACLQRQKGDILTLPSGSFRLASPANVGFDLPPPDPVRAAVVKSLAVDIRSGAADNLRDQRALVAEKERMEREAAYLRRGAAKTDEEMERIRKYLEMLEALRARGDAAAGALARLRDETMARINERTTRLLERSEENSIIAGAIRRFRAEGPNRERVEHLPPGVPSADSVAVQESAAADSLHSWIRSYSIVVPDLVRHSHAQVWEPRAIKDPNSLINLANEQLAWAKEVRRAIDSTMVVVQDPARLAPYEENARLSAEKLARLQNEQREARRSILADAIERARAAQAGEGEGIAFSLSIASHELAAADARVRARTEAEGGVPPANVADGSAARQRLASFLERYPDSRARGEIRYRLADLEIARAREEFASKMESFVGDRAPDSNQSVASLAPFVDYGPALELYQAILREDPNYPHRDAVLFHTGMILSDQGDPKARAHLQELVSAHPESPFCGRASLRMGDDDFEQHHLESAAAQFENAAAKGDDEVRSIALYKLGWVFYNLDRFDSAADSFFQLLDLYERDPEVLALTDLRDEAEESLIQSLARGGGAQSFAKTFGNETTRSFDLRVLSGLSMHLRELSQFEGAADCDSLLLARHAAAPEALGAAQRLVATLEEANRADRAMQARLSIAPLFARDSDWAHGVESDSLRTAGDEFARSSLETAALERHRVARESKQPQQWEEALALHESLLAKWPGHQENARTNFLAGEAALELGKHSNAIEHFTAAAQDSGTLGADASWQIVAVRDAWYENARTAQAPSDSLATSLLTEIDRFTNERPDDPRCPEALWRKADVAQRHSRFADAAQAYETFALRAPRDQRAPEAGRAAAHCRFKNAEAADADSSRALEAAKLFELVVEKSPSFEHGDAALYRAGLAYERGGSSSDAIRTWSTLLERYPKSELSRDAHLQIAAASKKSDHPEDAARAFERFSEAFPEDPEAAPALLEAADLLAKSDESGSEAMRTRYLERFPGDTEAAFEIMGPRAERELAGVKPGEDFSKLPAVASYRELAEKHPDLASAKILANVSYLEGEKARQAYEAAQLSQPLAPALAAKKALLETVLQEYRQCAEAAVEPWSIAGAYRIGESLVTFGEALGQSERPADMTPEDLAAYEEVLESQKWEFFDRGEQAWTELLKSAHPTTEEGKKWMEQTREKLWPRIARRFLHRPELEFPLLGAEPPKKATTQTASEGTGNGSGS